MIDCDAWRSVRGLAPPASFSECAIQTELGLDLAVEQSIADGLGDVGQGDGVGIVKISDGA